MLTVVSAAQAAPPNIIFILADDLGYGELGSYGQKLIATPVLDRMAAEGMRFTQFYAGSTVCAPSRSVLMTGQHTGHTRVRGNAGPDRLAAQTLQSDDVTFARLLQQAGYRTGLVGKWGLGLLDQPGEPRKQGFDTYFGYLSQTHAHNQFPDFLWRDGEKVTLPNDIVRVGPVEGAGYATKRVAFSGDLFAKEALGFVAENAGATVLPLSFGGGAAREQRALEGIGRRPRNPGLWTLCRPPVDGFGQRPRGDDHPPRYADWRTAGGFETARIGRSNAGTFLQRQWGAPGRWTELRSEVFQCFRSAHGIEAFADGRRDSSAADRPMAGAHSGELRVETRRLFRRFHGHVRRVGWSKNARRP